MSESKGDFFLTMAEAAALFPGRPSIPTLWRWCNKGVRRGVRLRTVAVGGRRLIPASAIDEFLRACTARVEGHAMVDSTADRRRSRSPRERASAIREAEQILKAR